LREANKVSIKEEQQRYLKKLEFLFFECALYAYITFHGDNVTLRGKRRILFAETK